MVRPEKSTIELTADLRNINVKMKPMPINAPSTFELGDTITLWCNYSINKDTGIKWTYDKIYSLKSLKVHLSHKVDSK